MQLIGQVVVRGVGLAPCRVIVRVNDLVPHGPVDRDALTGRECSEETRGVGEGWIERFESERSLVITRSRRNDRWRKNSRRRPVAEVDVYVLQRGRSGIACLGADEEHIGPGTCLAGDVRVADQVRRADLADGELAGGLGRTDKPCQDEDGGQRSLYTRSGSLIFLG